ncbi:Ferredoxin--NADP(+) reductase [Candidatus Terasakiella magnetica]|uniref:Ferredoxin--NADP(+) reductase n=1 Tax=Candidatus Terasakiella magnetica TaxID=1867952 RepID=A0A1C3RE40_9PROT|nr:FAD-dependent oxidoreductase [Candidatus Terasakiella magnetica]SCA55484.1 Ferredoxin--NADP(+) reductase [Candidatus Terasakiella magnetica]
MTAKIAIIGSGPSGFYAADTFAKKLPECQIDIIERLHTPFGLVRAGVAPDHQGTKNVTRQFERTMNNENVRFLGNVEIGKDISYGELKELYDIVFLAIGASVDRKMGIKGEELKGVYGSSAFVNWYNGHPDYVELSPKLGPQGVAIIGNGNVAIDIVRVLAKSSEEMEGSDLCQHAEEAIGAQDLSAYYMIGRRGAAQAAFTPSEANELGHLAQCHPVILNDDLSAEPQEDDPKAQKNKEKNMEILRALADQERGNKTKTLNMQFWAKPVEILGETSVEGLRLERTALVEGRLQGTGETFDIEVSTVISAIGYETAPFEGLPMAGTIVKNNEGVVEDGVYVSGWAKHGPQGTIPTNRKESMEMAKRAIEQFDGESNKQGSAGLDALLNERNVTTVDFDNWKKIEASEEAAARPGRVREKQVSF